MNRNSSIQEIRRKIGQQIRELIKEIKLSEQERNKSQADRWYCIVPLLMDRKHPEMAAWFQNPVFRNLMKNVDGVDEVSTGLMPIFVDRCSMRSMH
jgi:hypothetical protein